MPVTIIALVTVNEDEPMALAKYFEVTNPLLEKAQAKIIQRFEVKTALAGSKPSKSVVIVEYPNHDAVSHVFDSEEYKNVIEYRDKAFSTYQVSIVSN